MGGQKAKRLDRDILRLKGVKCLRKKVLQYIEYSTESFKFFKIVFTDSTMTKNSKIQKFCLQNMHSIQFK